MNRWWAYFVPPTGGQGGGCSPAIVLFMSGVALLAWRVAEVVSPA